MTLDADVKSFLDQMVAMNMPPPYKMPIEASRGMPAEQRALMDMPREEVGRRLERTVPGPAGPIPVRIYWPAAAERGNPIGVLVMFHGGGFALGDLDTFEGTVRYYCNHAEVVVVDVDYRLAPENKFPAAVEDCFAALCWVSDNAAELGVDADRLAVSGGSAGATLTIVCCLLAKERGGPEIALQVPVLPSLTFEQDPPYPSRAELDDDYYGLSRETIQWFADMYLGKPGDALDVRASPILAPDYTGLPPALVITGGYCPFRDEGRHYADRLREDGVDVEYTCYEGASHAAIAIPAMVGAAHKCVEQVTEFLQKRL